MKVELRDIHRRFGPVRANDGITLTVEPGTIHGLLGENGAGKSTLMRILSGFLRPDSGQIRLEDQSRHFQSPARAIAAGVGMIHQDPLDFPPLTVLDNFLMGRRDGAILDRIGAARALDRLGQQFDFRLDPEAPVGSLTVGERQQLEILRLLWLGAQVVILDEPTTGITAAQKVKLFATLNRLAGEGKTVIFVSHKLEEVEELCARVTVLRHGRVTGQEELPVPADRLVQLMFGETLERPARPKLVLGEVAVELEGVVIRDVYFGLEEIDLAVSRGEVLGLAGLEGSGQRLFLQACAGLLAPARGRLVINGRDMTGRPYGEFLKAGVAFLPAGRLEEGLIPGLSITEHLILSRRERQPFLIRWPEAERQAERLIRSYSIHGTPESSVEVLSGGNQQRTLLALMPEQLGLLLLEHPARGLDIESSAWVWNQLLARREGGATLIFASADLDELLTYSDRIAVFVGGRILDVVPARGTTEEDLGYLIGGKRRS